MGERNYYLDKQLLYKALSENLEKRFEETVGDNIYDGEYPKRFRRKMSKLIGADIENPDKKFVDVRKWVAIGLVAAIILTGCVFRKQIGSFIEEFWGTYISVKNEDEENTTQIIEEIYALTYVPEEYEYVREHSSPNLHTYIWQNSNNKALKFIQTKLSSSFYTDIELGYSYLMENNGVEVYCKIGNYDYSYKWNYDKYCFEILVEQELSQVEIKKIIDGIIIKE